MYNIHIKRQTDSLQDGLFFAMGGVGIMQKGEKMARKNLKYQFLQAINNSFRENMDKHSDKANGVKNTDKIYSYSSRSNLIDLSANYMRETYPKTHIVLFPIRKQLQENVNCICRNVQRNISI